jgi:3-oxoadipate enol-lactonase
LEIVVPQIRVNDIEIFYQVAGSGEPLLLIAGFACDHLIWSRVVPALSAHYRVVVFDNRGVGRTTGDTDAMGIRQLAEDAAALLDALGLGPAHVAGHSMGGMIAQELTLAHPAQVKSLMLVSSCARLDARGRAIVEAWGDLPKRLDPETSARLILPWMYTNAFFSTPGAVEETVALILANPYPPTAQVVYAQSRAISAADTSDRLNQVAPRTLALVGNEDILIPVSYSEQLVRSIPNAELKILDGTGHGLLIESPDAVAAALLDFLRKQSTHC